MKVSNGENCASTASGSEKGKKNKLYSEDIQKSVNLPQVKPTHPQTSYCCFS